MISLGLDPSLTGFGWAVHSSDAEGLKRRVASGHEATFPTTVPVARFMFYRSLVKRLISTFDPGIIGIESPAYDAGPFTPIHHSLMMFCLETIFENRKDCVLFDPATLKSLARKSSGNRGMMTKLNMQRFVQLDTNDADVIDNNEADAYCISYFAARFHGVLAEKIKPEDLTESEFRIFLGKIKKVNTVKGKKIKRVAYAFRENSRYFNFSKIPSGRVDLPEKSAINPSLIRFLEALDKE
jgi:hypothetical protein